MSPRRLAGCMVGAALVAAGCRTVDPWADLHDPAMEWRARAAAALGAMESADDVEQASLQLTRAWDEETVPLVRYAIVAALGQLGTARAEAVAAAALRDPDPVVRAAGARALGRLRELEHVPRLLERLHGDEDPSVRAAVASALAELDDPDAPLRLDEVPHLIRHLDDAPEVAVAAHAALRRLTLQTLPRDRAAWQSWWDRWQSGG